MGLPISVLARGPRARGADGDSAVRAVFAELLAVDAELSPYRPESAVSRLRRQELALDDAGPLVQQVAARCERARELTGGLFDATRPDGSWDPSGLVKGWAVERAARHLADVAGLDWCLNAGGDVIVLCPSGEPFTIGIQDPLDAGRVAATVRCSEGAVATSGTAARGQHLYDPRTGEPTLRLASVSVVGGSLETADVLATAAFVAGAEWPLPVSGYEALRIDRAGHLAATSGWPGVPAAAD